MTKTIKVLRMEDAKEDFSWALAFSDEEKVNLATRLLCDLWQTSHSQPFPRMDRQKVVYIQGARPPNHTARNDFVHQLYQ